MFCLNSYFFFPIKFSIQPFFQTFQLINFSLAVSPSPTDHGNVISFIIRPTAWTQTFLLLPTFILFFSFSVLFTGLFIHFAVQSFQLFLSVLVFIVFIGIYSLLWLYSYNVEKYILPRVFLSYSIEEFLIQFGLASFTLF